MIKREEFLAAVDAIDCPECGAPAGRRCKMGSAAPAHRVRVHEHKARLKAEAADPVALAEMISPAELEVLGALDEPGRVALQQCSKAYGIRAASGSWLGQSILPEVFPPLERRGLVMLVKARTRSGYAITALGSSVRSLRGRMPACSSSPCPPSPPCASS